MTATTLTTGSWRQRALCRGLPSQMFYPEVGDTQTAKDAIALCMTCPVRLACLEDALSDDADIDRYGIRGGLSPKARRRVRNGEPAKRVYKKPDKPFMMRWCPDRQKYVTIRD